MYVEIIFVLIKASKLKFLFDSSMLNVKQWTMMTDTSILLVLSSGRADYAVAIIE